MNDAGKIAENVIGFEALENSMSKCKKGVIWKDSVAHYCLNSIEENLKLEKQLKSGTYKARKPVCFKVTHPKERDIVSISFRDRIYQRSLNDNSIYPQMSRGFIYDNMACQKGKGTDKARERLKAQMQRHYRKHGLNGYVLKCDIKGYYPNMRHDVALGKFKKKLDTWTYERTKQVLTEQYSGEIGYNPGSQMVQIAGISVLDDLDHYIKEELRIKAYERYMDDFILIHESEEYLEHCKRKIEEKLNEIGFSFNEKKTKVQSIRKGITFLGFTFKLTETGKVIMIINPKNVKQERKKLYRLVQQAKRGEKTKAKVDECYYGWRNHAQKGSSTKLLRRMDKYYKDLWKGEQNNVYKEIEKKH